MNVSDTSIRMRGSERAGVMREQQKTDRLAATIRADSSVGAQLAAGCRGIKAAEMVETLHFKDTGNIFYQFKTRPYGEFVIFAKTPESAAQVLDFHNITMERFPKPQEAAGFSSSNVIRPLLLIVYDRSPVTLVHESVHVALRILERIGQPRVEAGSEERMAYLCDDLFAAFSPYL
ncbi:hypothetical protein [Caballeronia sp. M23-90]